MDECRCYQTTDERKQRINGSCFVCMKQWHRVGDCELNKSCYYCGQIKNHYRSFCPQKFGEASREGAHLVEEIPEEEASETENILLPSSEMVLKQTATGDIINPSTRMIQNVRMLLKSGSQQTI